ncbi:hypothetical protein KI387_015299, partial [Taxus chinensis]
TRKFYTSKDVELFEKKKDKAPSKESPYVDSKPIVKIESDVPIDDDSDEGDD